MRTTLVALLLTLMAVSAWAGVAPGDKAIQIALPDTEGNMHSLHEYLQAGQVVVLEWFNADCPFIRKHHEHHQTMNETFAQYRDQGVVWLAINSSAEGKQGAGLERNQRAVKEYAMPFPVLMDPDGAVGKAYGAKTTPHMFVIAADGVVAYAGAIDDDRSAGDLGDTNYVAEALEQVLAGKAVKVSETRAYGCSVKY